MPGHRVGPAWVSRLDAPGDGPSVAVKDAIDVAGLPTVVGSRVLAERPPAAVDAACVAQVRRAGGRIVGKTSLTELCWFADGVNEITGTPPNLLDPDRVPGGSSSGSAVVVARGECDVALGTDTGGSVRIPAACCGVAGLKTTHGRVPLGGVFPLAPGLDTVGPLARDVAGLAVGMGLLEPGFAVEPAPARPRVARLLPVTEHAVAPSVDEEVDAALDATGWEVSRLPLPDWDPGVTAALRILDAEAGPAQGWLLDRAELLSPRAREFIEHSLRQAARPDQVAEAREVVAGLRDRLQAALAGVDALILPTLAVEVPLVGELDEVVLVRLTVLFNALGWPAVAVPAWPPAAGERIPASLQVVGPPRSEERLLGLAACLPSQRG